MASDDLTRSPDSESRLLGTARSSLSFTFQHTTGLDPGGAPL